MFGEHGMVIKKTIGMTFKNDPDDFENGHVHFKNRRVHF